jgi:hypothetical protein
MQKYSNMTLKVTRQAVGRENESYAKTEYGTG